MSESSRPDTVLFEALNSFFGMFVGGGDLGGKDPEMRARLKQRITGIIGFGMDVEAEESSSPSLTTAPSDASCMQDLVQSIPNLGTFLGDCYHCQGKTKDLAHFSRDQLLQRSKFLLCKLIGAIADATSPIVLVGRARPSSCYIELLYYLLKLEVII